MKHGRVFWPIFYFTLFCLSSYASLALAGDGGIHLNPKVTPGKLCTAQDSNFDGFVYPSQIAHCVRNVDTEMKRAVANAYGVDESQWRNFEFDHLVPLCAGGTNSTLNLWPEPLDHAHLKDRIENKMCVGLRDGQIDQQQALKILWDWLAQNPVTITVTSDIFMQALGLPEELR